jgi:hypothetical protein
MIPLRLVARRAKRLAVFRYGPTTFGKRLYVVGVEGADERITTILAHISGHYLQHFSLTPRKEPVQRLIQYSVIKISRNGSALGG